MKVDVKCFGNLSEGQSCDQHGGQKVELAAGATVKNLAETLKLDVEEIKIIFVNNKEVTLDQALNDGDVVALSPKSGGM